MHSSIWCSPEVCGTQQCITGNYKRATDTTQYPGNTLLPKTWTVHWPLHPDTIFNVLSISTLLVKVQMILMHNWRVHHEKIEFDSADIINFILEKTVSYQKKDGRGHARPFFFGMTTTNTLRSVFSWREATMIKSEELQPHYFLLLAVWENQGGFTLGDCDKLCQELSAYFPWKQSFVYYRLSTSKPVKPSFYNNQRSNGYCTGFRNN